MRLRKVLIIMLLIVLLLGITSQCYARAVSFSEIQVEEVPNAQDYSGASMSLNALIGAAITITQVLGTFISVLIITIWIIKMIIRKIKINNMKQAEDVDEEELKEMIKKYDALKDRGAIYIGISILLFAVSGILGIVKSFKPVIYIYPEKDGTVVNVSLSDPERITCSYPEYNDGWTVVADKDGTLKEVGKERSYYSLYWEGLIHKKEFKDGFVVKGEDTAEFLEEKLEILGLNEKEAEEFIIYWLPKMENNNYNLIRFLETDELNEEMKLEIDPKPDTLIRIQMQFKPLVFEKDIPEQQLEKVTRDGFTVVEWGASEVR